MKINRRRFVVMAGASFLVGYSGGCGPVADGDERPKDPTKELIVSSELIATCKGHKNSVTDVDISPDGKLVVSGGSDQALRFWSAADGKPIRKIQAIDPPEKVGGFSDVKFSPDGSLVAALVKFKGPLLRFWEVETGKEVQSRIPVESGSDLAFSPDGSKLAIAGYGAQVWDLKDARKLHDFQPGKGIIAPWVTAGVVTFSPDGTCLAATLGWGGGPPPPEGEKRSVPNVRVWDLSNEKEVFASAAGAPRTLAFSPDGNLLAAGAEDPQSKGRVAWVWNLTTKKQIHALPAGKHTVFCLAFSPNGRALATGGHDPAIKLWDVRSGRLAAKLEGHTDQVKDLAFSKDGKTLVSAGMDKLVLIWRIDQK